MIIKKQSENSVLRILQQLRNGLPVVLPCDTIYGFCGIIPKSKEPIVDLKGRDENKPFIWLIPNNDISSFSNTVIPKPFLDYWPGPVTYIVGLKEPFASSLGQSTAAVRLPNDPFLLAILTQLNAPLFSTSVNKSGTPPMNDPAQIAEVFDSPDLLIVDGGLYEGVPSTLVDLTSPVPKVLREGAVKVKEAVQN